MYDSRSSHPRGNRFERESRAYRHWLEYCGKGRLKGRDEALTAAEAIAEGLADMAEDVPQVEHQFSQRYLNRLHAEALRENDRRWQEEMDEAWAWLDHQMDEQVEYDEDADEGYPETWMTVLTMTEAREHFGPDWEHNGFQITHHGRPYARQTKEKHMQEDIERAMALQSAAAQRTRIERLTADIKADARAKVERPEPTPYEKFAGASSKAPHYDDSLDPISPNFDRSAW
jgi:hypothetical protein